MTTQATSKHQTPQQPTGMLRRGARSQRTKSKIPSNTRILTRVLQATLVLLLIIIAIFTINMAFGVIRAPNAGQNPKEQRKPRKIIRFEEAFTNDGVALRSGDMIRIPTVVMGVKIYHFGIVTSITSSHSFMILHNTGDELGVQLEPYNSMVPGIEIVERRSREISWIEALRLQQEYSDQSYDLCRFNCEHFARKIHSGVALSEQTGDWSTLRCAASKASVRLAFKLLQLKAEYSTGEWREAAIERMELMKDSVKIR